MNHLTLQEYKTAPIETLLPVLVFMQKHNNNKADYDSFFRCSNLPCMECILPPPSKKLNCMAINKALAERFNLENVKELDLSKYKHSHPEHFI